MAFLIFFVAIALAVSGAYFDGRSQGRAEAKCEAKCGPTYVLGRDRQCGCPPAAADAKGDGT